MRKSDNIELTQEILRDILEYNPKEGTWIWLNPSKYGSVKYGDKAGYITNRKKKSGIEIKYNGICINRKKYYLYRLAFLYMIGRYPLECVDHINGDSLDDRWCNLREATYIQNNQNKTFKTKQSSLPMGVRKKRNKYSASIYLNGKPLQLGCYDTPDEAYNVYLAKRREIYGEFNRL